jgi:hypothetical protein
VHETPPGTARSGNRGFWVIAAALAIAAAVVVIAALVTRPDPPSGRATDNLEVALNAARIVREESGTWAEATAQELRVVELTLDFVPGGETSTGPTVISVQPGDETWVATARASDGLCHVIETGPGGDVSRGRFEPVPVCAAGRIPGGAFPTG